MPRDEELLDDIDIDEDETGAEEPDEDVDPADASEDDDDELEYDDEGNVIIPDDDNEAGDDDDDKDDHADDGKKAETDERYAELQKQHQELLSQVKDTLKKLGVKDTDLNRGLAKLAADEEGISVDEYLKKRASDLEAEEALRIVKQQRFQQMAANDLAEIKAAYAGLDDVKTIQDIPNFKRFAELRDKGLTAKEAYVAANPERIRTQAAESAKKKTLEDTKAHLKSTVPKGSKDSGIKMSRAELNAWRDMFPNKSDKEIAKLYRDTL